MSLVKVSVLLFLIAEVYCREPAVRFRITQKGLDFAMEYAVKQTKQQLESYPVPDVEVHSKLLASKYSITSIKITNVVIPGKSMRPVPNKGLYSVVRNVSFDLSGKWKYKMSDWFSYDGGFSIKIRGMSMRILTSLAANESRLMVSNVTCASVVSSVDIKATEPHSWIFNFFRGIYVRPVVKTKIPKIACEETEKAIKNNLNKEFAKFPGKKILEKSIILDYSVGKEPVFNLDSLDLFFKGEFQPIDNNLTWLREPRQLPTESEKDRMAHVTVMDHMANSGAKAFYSKGKLKVEVPVEEVHRTCSSCGLRLQMEATSPPHIETDTSGVKVAVRGIAKFKSYYPNNSSKNIMILAMNVTAKATPKLNGTTLITAIDHIRIATSVLRPTVFTALPDSHERFKANSFYSATD